MLASGLGTWMEFQLLDLGLAQRWKLWQFEEGPVIGRPLSLPALSVTLPSNKSLKMCTVVQQEQILMSIAR